MDEMEGSELAVFAIWMPAFPGDARDRWSPNLLTDERVQHYWDEDFVIGTWYKDQPDFARFPGPHVWDAYVLYGPDAVWDTVPGPLAGWGATIMGERDELTEQLRSLLTQ